VIELTFLFLSVSFAVSGGTIYRLMKKETADRLLDLELLRLMIYSWIATGVCGVLTLLTS
jgi:hypothetical protein